MKPLEDGDPSAIGAYELLGRLGSGGMGEVFLGRTGEGRLAAVKAARSELAHDAEFRRRFAREVDAARQVDARFTAAVLDADPGARRPWLATEYIPGVSVTEAVVRSGPLPEAPLLVLAAGVAAALDAIHRAGLTHRDLKPSNVLLAEDGPRVIDFGIARSVEHSQITRTGQVPGTPGYMAPEQLRGGEIGPHTDVYALGATLVYAATGEGPFGHGDVFAMMYRTIEEQPHVTEVPHPLRETVTRCLSKEPAQRPTVADLRLEFEVPATLRLGGRGEWLPREFATFPLGAAGETPGVSPDGKRPAGPEGGWSAAPGGDALASSGDGAAASPGGDTPASSGGDALASLGGDASAAGGGDSLAPSGESASAAPDGDASAVSGGGAPASSGGDALAGPGGEPAAVPGPAPLGGGTPALPGDDAPALLTGDAPAPSGGPASPPSGGPASPPSDDAPPAASAALTPNSAATAPISATPNSAATAPISATPNSPTTAPISPTPSSSSAYPEPEDAVPAATAQDDDAAPAPTGTPAPRNRLSRRALLGVSAAVAAAGVSGTVVALRGFGEGEGGPEGGAPSYPFQVGDRLEVVLPKGGAYSTDYLKDALNRFQEVFPEVDLRRTWASDVSAEVMPRFTADEAPDLINNAGSNAAHLRKLASAHRLLDLTPLLDAPAFGGPERKVRDALAPGVVEKGRLREGEKAVHALYYEVNAYGFWYSRKALEKLGAGYPKTWDDLLDVCGRAKETGMAGVVYPGKYPYYFWYVIAASIGKRGGREVLDALYSGDPEAWDAESVLDVFESYHELAVKGHLWKASQGYDFAQAQQAWVQGKALFMPNGSWVEGEVADLTPAGFDMAVGPPPSVDASDKLPFGALSVGYANPFVVPRDAEHPDAALELLRIMLGRKAAGRYEARNKAVVATRTTLRSTERSAPGTASARAAFEAAGGDTFVLKEFDPPRLQDRITVLIGEMLVPRATPGETVERIQSAVLNP